MDYDGLYYHTHMQTTYGQSSTASFCIPSGWIAPPGSGPAFSHAAFDPRVKPRPAAGTAGRLEAQKSH